MVAAIAAGVALVFTILAPTVVEIVVVIWLGILLHKAESDGKKVDEKDVVRNSALSFFFLSDTSKSPKQPKLSAQQPDTES